MIVPFVSSSQTVTGLSWRWRQERSPRAVRTMGAVLVIPDQSKGC
jgi:hypothetical protein